MESARGGITVDVRVGKTELESASSDSEEWDDPSDTLMVPEADSNTVKMLQANGLSQSPSPTRREDADPGNHPALLVAC